MTYTKGISRVYKRPLRCSVSLEDGFAYSLRAPHNATSVIGDPAEFRGEGDSNGIRDNKQTRKAMRREGDEVKGEDNFEIGISKA